MTLSGCADMLVNVQRFPLLCPVCDDFYLEWVLILCLYRVLLLLLVLGSLKGKIYRYPCKYTEVDHFGFVMRTYIHSLSLD